MEIEKNNAYTVYFSQRENVQKTIVHGVNDPEELTTFIKRLFRGRFKRPEALALSDGVRIVVHDSSNRRVFDKRIYNKSVRQARIEMEIAINKLQ